MDLKKIKAILDLVKESGIAELEITEGEEKLKVSTVGTQSHSVQYQPVLQQQYPHISQQHHQPENEIITNKNIETSKEVHYIKSPMVGTFYIASSPTTAPFVEVGKEVKVGQVVCIVEAMKLMNQIESDRSGVITEILVKDGAPVEYGQPLFVVE
ncbi:MAG TPA: acetyl-CoA carboxylase biotin carboxyl carrier protein [Burkholderiales bacterium]|nr:acetyl-CoA carboxylase biotin carboxyl carrier protein [Burkholderiales bacterium]